MLKKSLFLALAIALAISIINFTAFAAGPISVYLNGTRLTFDVPPQLINNRTMVPLRAIFEAMGAKVDWNGDTETVTGTKGDRVVVLTIGNTSPTINGQVVTIDQPGVIVNNRTLAPLRFVAEAFGGGVTWDGNTQTASITMDGTAAAPPLAPTGPMQTPAPAAAPPGQTQTPAPPLAMDIDTVSMNALIGKIIQFGNYNWLVLEVKDGKALLLSEKIIEPNIYSLELTASTWQTCFLRQSLNDRFLKSFSSVEQKRIAETTIGNPDNLWYGTPGGADTKDKIFLLSLEEADKYFGDSGDYLNLKRKAWGGDGGVIERDSGWALSNDHDSERVAILGYGESWWWLRSPGATSNSAAAVNVGGSINVRGRDVNAFHPEMGGVRPALWLILE